MRYEEVKKRLWTEGIVVAAVMSVLVGGSYYLTTVHENSAHQNKQLETQVNTIVATMNTLRNKFSAVQQNADLYQEILRKSASDQLNISREFIRKKFDQFKARYYLSSLRISMQPMQERAAKNKDSANVIVASEVKAVFFALTDEDVYSLLEAMQQEMSGAVKITEINLKRRNPLTDDAIASIRKTGQAQLVDGEILFTWLGIKSTEAGVDDVNATEAKP
jgi:hypothetical protein